MSRGTAEPPDLLSGRHFGKCHDGWVTTLRPDVHRELCAVVGSDHVVCDPQRLHEAERATFATRGRVHAILRPGSAHEVAATLRVASQYGTALHPTSGGRNWGLGSRVPPGDGAVLLDLGRLRRITDYDDELACVTVEAGVTFAELYRYLTERESRLFMSTIGASPEASVLINAIERGDGSGPYGDRFAHLASLEVALPGGEIIHTGFGRFGPSAVAAIHRWGVGPTLDGLFSQSNLGVVTRGTIWLSPLPKALGTVRFRFRDPARLAAVVDAVRELRLEGTLRSVVGIWNDYRVLSVEGRYPWQRAGGRTPLPRPVVDELARAWGGARWFGLAAVYAATRAQCDANLERVRERLTGVVDELDVDVRTGEPTSGSELFHEEEPALQFLQGIPHEGSLRSVYWRKLALPERLDPDRDGCGVLWACPTVPLRGRDALAAVELSERTLTAHGFEPLLALVAQTERTGYLIPMIVYDRDVAGEDERALACHDQLLGAFVRLGYLPHRLGLQSWSSLPAAQDDYDRVLLRLKRCLDPADILSPSRYDFRQGEE